MKHALAAYLNQTYFASRPITDAGTCGYLVDKCIVSNLYCYTKPYAHAQLGLCSVQVKVTDFVAYLFDPAQPQAEELRLRLNQTIQSYNNFSNAPKGSTILARKQACTRQLARVLEQRIDDFTGVFWGRGQEPVLVFGTRQDRPDFEHKRDDDYTIGLIVRGAEATMRKNAAKCGIPEDKLFFQPVGGLTAEHGAIVNTIRCYREDGALTVKFDVEPGGEVTLNPVEDDEQSHRDDVHIYHKKRKLRALASL